MGILKKYSFARRLSKRHSVDDGSNTNGQDGSNTNGHDVSPHSEPNGDGVVPKTNGENYTNGTAGTSIGDALGKTKQVNKRHSSFGPITQKDSDAPERKDVDRLATRKDVESTFEQFSQLIHSAQRPLPSQTGDGSYLEKEESSGLWADFKSLGVKDVATVKHIMEDKASGKPQDDRKMHMEEVIQVRTPQTCPQKKCLIRYHSLSHLFHTVLRIESS